MALLPFNCLLENTQLYKDLSAFVKKIIVNRIADGKDVSINDVYKEARDSHFLDVDMNTVGEMYKAITPTIKAPKGTFDSNSVVDAESGKILNNAVKKIISKRRSKTIDEVGRQKPSAAIATDILRMFENDYIGLKGQLSKTVMKEMQDAIKKAATAVLQKQGTIKQNATFQEILTEALRLDDLAVTDLNGQLNNMDKLFNEVSKEIDAVVDKLEKSKRGMSAAKQAEIDLRIQQLQNYTQNIQQGAYTLALTRQEQQKVLRDILKKPFGKDVTVNGKTERVLDWNKMFRESKDIVSDISGVLTKEGFNQNQIQKIAGALKTQYDAIKASAQWNNLASNGTAAAMNDDAFLTRAAVNVVLSKKDDKGKPYSVYNPQTGKNEPDWNRWAADKGQTIQQLKDEIKQDITAKGNASNYRQIVSELARKNNPAKKVTKSDLEQLARLSDIYGFDSKFNAKVYEMLGLNEKDVAAGQKVEDLSKKIKDVFDKGGKGSKIAITKLQEDINAVMAETQGNKSRLLRFARWFEWALGNRNAWRLLNPVNIVENSLSGVSQIIQSRFQAMSKEAAQKEFKKMLTVAGDVFQGGQHFDVTDIERLSFVAHDYKWDDSKDMSHNIKAAMSFLPNVMLGVLDSATHSYTMRIAFYNSAVKVRQSKLMKDKAEQSGRKINELTKKEKEDLKQQAITDVSNALYDDTAEKEALAKAEEILKITTPNPTKNEIQREADNLMFNNIVKAGILNEGQLDALKRAADTSAKKSIGKVGVNWTQKIPLVGGQSTGQAKYREAIKKSIQKGNYNLAAAEILGSAIMYKGLFPFVSGAFNWGVIGLKKIGVGALSSLIQNTKSFREQVEMAADLNDRDLEKIMEKNATLRNDAYYFYQGFVYSALVFAAMAGYAKANGDDDDAIDSVANMLKELRESNRNKQYLTRWLPPMLHAYNTVSGIARGDINDNALSLATQYSGLDVLESPITKYTKYAGRGADKQMAGIGSMMGGIFDVGSYYSAPNSFIDAFMKEQTEKPTAFRHEYSNSDKPLLSGILFGLMGYRLNQDLEHYGGFSNMASELNPFGNK